MLPDTVCAEGRQTNTQKVNKYIKKTIKAASEGTVNGISFWNILSTVTMTAFRVASFADKFNLLFGRKLDSKTNKVSDKSLWFGNYLVLHVISWEL